jgi:TRAP transporter TAXI family solute receptor
MRLRLLAAVATVAAGCAAAEPERTRHSIRLATGTPTGSFYAVGNALATLVDETRSDINVVVEASTRSVENLDSLEQGSSDLGFARADAAYRSYAQDAVARDKLRGVAVVYPSVLHVVVRQGSPFQRISDLRRHRVGYLARGPDAPSSIPYFDLMAAGGGLRNADVRSGGMTFSSLTEALADREIAAAFMVVGYPVPVLTQLSQRVGLRLLDIETEAAAEIRAHHPHYKPSMIPAGTYEGQNEAVSTVGIDNLLLCRAELDEDLVYRFTKTLFELLPRLTERLEVTRQIDPNLAPATPIRLHPGAARYYRERELLK